MGLTTTRHPTGSIYLRQEKSNARGEATGALADGLALTQMRPFLTTVLALVYPILSVDADLGANIGLQDTLTAYCEFFYHPSVSSVDILRAARNDDNLRTAGTPID